MTDSCSATNEDVSAFLTAPTSTYPEVTVPWVVGAMKKAGAPAKVLIENITTPGAPADAQSKIHAATEPARARHGVCIAHVRKWVWNRLREIEGWDWCRGRIWLLMTELPRGGGRGLRDMEPLVRGQPKLHRLMVELSEKWRSLTCHQRVIGMPQTNSCTERTIGRSKACAGLRSDIRYRTVRGYKSEEGMMNGL